MFRRVWVDDTVRLQDEFERREPNNPVQLSIRAACRLYIYHVVGESRIIWIGRSIYRGQDTNNIDEGAFWGCECEVDKVICDGGLNRRFRGADALQQHRYS